MRRHLLLRASLAVVVLLIATSAMAQIGAVRGLVQDLDGKPIKGATIRASNPQGRPNQITATSDDHGRFAIIGLVGGLWSFIAEAPGYGQQKGEMRIRATTLGNPRLEFVLGRTDGLLPGMMMREAPSDLDEAGEMRDSGQLDQAIAAYQEIATKNPALTMVNMVIGDAYRTKANKEPNAATRSSLYDRAISSYQLVVKSDPENDRARIELAMTHMERGNVEEAESTLAAPATAPSAGRDIVFSLAEVKLKKGDTAGAEPLFQRAASMDPAWSRPKLRLGMIAMRKGDKDTAVNLLSAVVAADAASPEAVEAGSYLKQLGR